MLYGESLKVLDDAVVVRAYKEIKRRITYRYGTKICSQLANFLSSTIKEVKQKEGWLAIKYNGRSFSQVSFICVEENKVFVSKAGSLIIPICKVDKNDRPKHKTILESLEYRLDEIMFKVFNKMLSKKLEDGVPMGELVLMVENLYQVCSYGLTNYIDNYDLYFPEDNNKNIFDTFRITNALNPKQQTT